MASSPSSDSDSSVATVDEGRISYFKETAILHKKKAGLDPTKWPTFVLNDVTVYRQDGKTLANALYAELDGPFIVRGKLDIEGAKQAQHRQYCPTHTILTWFLMYPSHQAARQVGLY